MVYFIYTFTHIYVHYINHETIQSLHQGNDIPSNMKVTFIMQFCLMTTKKVFFIHNFLTYTVNKSAENYESFFFILIM